MQLGHLLTRSGLTYPEVSSKVCHNSFCQVENSVSVAWVIYYEAFYLHVVSSFSCIPVIFPEFVLFLIPYLYEIITKRQKQDITGIKLSKNQQLSTLLFADDQVIIADTEDNLQKAAHKLNQIITEYDLTISVVITLQLYPSSSNMRRVWLLSLSHPLSPSPSPHIPLSPSPPSSFPYLPSLSLPSPHPPLPPSTLCHSISLPPLSPSHFISLPPLSPSPLSIPLSLSSTF